MMLTKTPSHKVLYSAFSHKHLSLEYWTLPTPFFAFNIHLAKSYSYTTGHRWFLDTYCLTWFLKTVTTNPIGCDHHWQQLCNKYCLSPFFLFQSKCPTPRYQLDASDFISNHKFPEPRNPRILQRKLEGIRGRFLLSKARRTRKTSPTGTGVRYTQNSLRDYWSYLSLALFELPGRGRTHQSQTPLLGPRHHTPPLRRAPGTRVEFRTLPSSPYARSALTSASDAVVAPAPTARGPVRWRLGGLPKSLLRTCPPRNGSRGSDPCGGSGSCGRRRCCSCCRRSDSESPRSALRPEPWT